MKRKILLSSIKCSSIKNVMFVGALAVGSSPLISPSVYANVSTGSVRGTVVVGAEKGTVEIVDASRGRSRTSQLDGEGKFGFRSLPPGKYSVRLKVDGVIVDAQEVRVTLGGNLLITLGNANQVAENEIEEVAVVGRRLNTIDTGIAEAGLVISADELLELPVARDLESVTMLAPGVTRSDSAFDGNNSFSGASAAENTTYVNGLNITNFRNGLGFSKVPFEAYESLQVKTGGYSAKFGRSIGGVVNTTTKSGTNDFKAGANFYSTYQTDTSPNTFENFNDRDAYQDSNFDLWASGALIQDRLFFYTLVNQNEVEQDSRFGIGENTTAHKEKESTTFWLTKLDAYLSENHRVEFTAFSDERVNVDSIYEFNSETDTLGEKTGFSDENDGGLNWTAKYVASFTDNFEMSIQYGRNEFDTTIKPSTADRPSVYRITEDGRFQNANGNASFRVEDNIDKREQFRMDFTWDLGDHLVEFGLDVEDNLSINDTINSGGTYWALDAFGARFTCSPAECPTGATARNREYSVGGEFKVKSNAYYIQDIWQVTDNLQLELGLRNDAFANYNGEDELFIEVKDQWAPRLSAVWDPTGNGNQKLYASTGLYYLPVAANTNVRLAGNETYIHRFYAWDGECVGEFEVPCNVAAEPYATVVNAPGGVPDTRSVVNENIEPMYQSELIMGYEFIDDSGILYGVKGIYRNLETAIDDVAIDQAVRAYYNAGRGVWDLDDTVEEVFSGTHQYVLTNPGNDMRVYIPEAEEWIDLSAEDLGYPKATRKYAALELSLKRPFDGSWMADLSYVWGHNWGNTEGQVRSDNGQDDAGLTTAFDQPGLMEHSSGNLPNDRPHTLKARGMYQLENGLRFGSSVMWQSGRPINCFGRHPTDADIQNQYNDDSFYCNGQPSPRGSRGRTPNLWSLDVNAQYTFALNEMNEVEVSLDVFNLFNNDKFDQIEEIGESGRDSAVANPNYFKPTSYQEPREIRLSARYRFN